MISSALATIIERAYPVVQFPIFLTGADELQRKELVESASTRIRSYNRVEVFNVHARLLSHHDISGIPYFADGEEHLSVPHMFTSPSDTLRIILVNGLDTTLPNDIAFDLLGLALNREHRSAFGEYELDSNVVFVFSSSNENILPSHYTNRMFCLDMNSGVDE